MSETQGNRGAMAVVEDMRGAINGHDLEAMVRCFAADYESTFPAHPDRAFTGNDQVRKNWEQIFGAVPDLHAEILAHSLDGDTSWVEWEWAGTRRDGAPFFHRGVTIQAIKSGKIAWARLYMEPVEVGQGVDSAIQKELSLKGQASEAQAGRTT